MNVLNMKRIKIEILVSVSIERDGNLKNHGNLCVWVLF